MYRYAIELLNYPELTEEEYVAVMADLKNPEDDPLYLAAQEKLICSHLGMVLSMAINTSFKYYGLSMEDFVGIGNHAIVERFSYFKPNKQARFSTYMRKVVERWGYGNLKKYILIPILERFGVPPEYREYYISYYIEGIAAVIRVWLGRNCEDSTEMIAAVIEECVRPKGHTYDREK